MVTNNLVVACCPMGIYDAHKNIDGAGLGRSTCWERLADGRSIYAGERGAWIALLVADREQLANVEVRVLVDTLSCKGRF